MLYNAREMVHIIITGNEADDPATKVNMQINSACLDCEFIKAGFSHPWRKDKT